MTGRPSGRCAAAEALERIANVGDHGLRIGAERDALRYAEKEARDALASPCCVSAADQEQVKEAERAFLDASIAVWREIDRLSDEPGGYRGLSQSEALRLRERAAWERYRDALALLGSNEEEAQDG